MWSSFRLSQIGQLGAHARLFAAGQPFPNPAIHTLIYIPTSLPRTRRRPIRAVQAPTSDIILFRSYGQCSRNPVSTRLAQDIHLQTQR
jgi:hypothetical protein